MVAFASDSSQADGSSHDNAVFVTSVPIVIPLGNYRARKVVLIFKKKGFSTNSEQSAIVPVLQPMAH